MKRRTFATAAGASLASLAGCLGDLTGSNGNDGGDVSSDSDGYPEAVAEKPEDREVDTSNLQTVRENGVDVPLLPVDDAHVWWAYKRARFADARGPDQYESSHIQGAVFSSAAPRFRDQNDPTKSWGKQDNIVCYCGCPHHLSSIRASQLINEGYENVYVIDEGFFEWRDRGYPVTGSSSNVSEFVVEGEVHAKHAGENAWVQPVDSDQLESTNVAADGSFALHCKFVDVTPDSVLRVDTPAWSTTGTVRELTSGILRGN